MSEIGEDYDKLVVLLAGFNNKDFMFIVVTDC
jgi:hypothetical protein